MMNSEAKEIEYRSLPSVSVVVPALNNEETISRTIESLKNMDYPREKLEIIVVDDASNDKTGKIALNHGARVVKREKRGGCAGAKNTGVSHARSEIIAFVDANVTVDKDWLKELVTPFKDTSVGATGGSVRAKYRRNHSLGKYISHDVDYRKRNVNTRSVPGSNSAYRREVFEIVGKLDPYLGEDPDFSYRVSNYGYKIVFTERAIVYHPSFENVWTYFKKQIYYGWQRIMIFLLRPECRSAVIKDEHTPYVVLLQPLILMAATLSLLLIPFFESFIFLFLGLLALFTAVNLPFFFRILSKEATLLPFVFFISFIKSFAYMIGIVQGFVSYAKIKIVGHSKAPSSNETELPSREAGIFES